jgi:hypothetical protein
VPQVKHKAQPRIAEAPTAWRSSPGSLKERPIAEPTTTMTVVRSASVANARQRLGPNLHLTPVRFNLLSCQAIWRTIVAPEPIPPHGQGAGGVRFNLLYGAVLRRANRSTIAPITSTPATAPTMTTGLIHVFFAGADASSLLVSCTW